MASSRVGRVSALLHCMAYYLAACCMNSMEAAANASIQHAASAVDYIPHRPDLTTSARHAIQAALRVPSSAPSAPVEEYIFRAQHLGSAVSLLAAKPAPQSSCRVLLAAFHLLQCCALRLSAGRVGLDGGQGGVQASGGLHGELEQLEEQMWSTVRSVSQVCCTCLTD